MKMTTRIYRVDFHNNFHVVDVVAKSIYQAVRAATRLWKEELFSKKTTGDTRFPTPRRLWRYYGNQGYTTVTTVDLIAESEN